MNLDPKRWEAVLQRDASQDGKFWYGVLSTGVFCRPSCASRRPNPKNVRFFSSTQAAAASGLRACKRCKPEEGALAPKLSTLLELCRHIETHAEQAHTLAALAARSGLSQFQVHRLFKAFLRLTPKEYIAEVRLRALKQRLRTAASVTDAIYDAGFESSSAVYGRMDAHLGMTPQHYRAGGAGVDISFAFGRTARAWCSSAPPIAVFVICNSGTANANCWNSCVLNIPTPPSQRRKRPPAQSSPDG